MDNLNTLLPGSFCGLQIYENPNMTIDGEPYEVRRTWKDRIFSWPWRPLKRTRTVVPQIPDPEFLKMGNKVVGHPETVRALKQAVALLAPPKLGLDS